MTFLTCFLWAVSSPLLMGNEKKLHMALVMKKEGIGVPDLCFDSSVSEVISRAIGVPDL
jgi:hypothetical protein